MIATRMGFTVALGAAIIFTGVPVAQANPTTPMGVIESSAAQLCTAVDADPTPDGVMEGLASLDRGDLDEMDGALILITAVHHVCPQHENLVMGTMEPVAADEICPKSSF